MLLIQQIGVLFNNSINEGSTAFPGWLIPFIIYVIGFVVSFFAVRFRSKKWYEKLAYMLFWPLYFIHFLILTLKWI